MQRGHTAEVNAVALAADGDLLVSASADSTVRLWRVGDGNRELLGVLPEHLIGVNALALGVDGRFLASGDGAGRVRSYDISNGRPILPDVAPPHVRALRDLLAGPGGELFLSRDDDGRVVRWRVEGIRLRPVVLADDGARAIAAAPRGKLATPLAVALSDGKIALHAATGKAGPIATVEGPGGSALVLSLDADGRLAAGDEKGRLLLRDLTRPERPAIARWSLDSGPVHTLSTGPDGRLAIGAGDSLWLVRPGADAPVMLPDVVEEIRQAAFSADGRWLAACTAFGTLHLWDLTDPAPPRARLPVADAGAAAPAVVCLAFAADGRRLALGEADGGLRTIDLPAVVARPRIEPSRGQVARLDAWGEDPASRFLLLIDKDGRACQWDLKEGRGPHSLDGHWADGAFLPPDGRRLAMVRHADEGGDVVLIDRDRGTVVDSRNFARPPAANGGRSFLEFDRVAVSPDGRWIAAAPKGGRDERLCLWPATGGAPEVLAGHAGSINDLGFATVGDSSRLVTACDDGALRLWRIGEDGAKDRPLVVRLPTRAGDPPFRAATAAQLDPTGAPRLLVTYSVAGGPAAIFLWTWSDSEDQRRFRPVPTRLGELSGRAHAVTFARDGRFAVVAGDDRRIRAWELPSGAAPRESRIVLPGNRAHHDEQVNALVSLAGGPIVASGSDDASIRLWRLGEGEPNGGGPLIGTLVAASDASGGDGDWVAFTPDGHFDGSQQGEQVVRFVVDRRVRPLEQYTEALYTFGLTDGLRAGQRPDPVALPEAPAIAIDPPAEPETERRTVRLRIRLADPKALDLSALRLYQNGVPVKSGEGDFESVDRETGTVEAEVQLRSGSNRFYAMAGQVKNEGVDARSGDVELKFLGFDSPGRTHVVALGVSDYVRYALRYAHRDAQTLGAFLHEQTINGTASENQPGELVVLTDRDVTRRAVEEAFTRVRQAAKGRPEDTVVVFLAGHTDILEGAAGERFSLLLHDFPFPDDAPLFVGLRGVGIAGGVKPAEFPRESYLPFVAIYRELPHIDALQRLIIVDACQAETVLDDRGVQAVRKALETGSRKPRSAYFLAARFGEPAGEDPVLKHGLLTYVLLWGLGAPGLEAPRGPNPPGGAVSPMPIATTTRSSPQPSFGGSSIATSPS